MSSCPLPSPTNGKYISIECYRNANTGEGDTGNKYRLGVDARCRNSQTCTGCVANPPPVSEYPSYMGLSSTIAGDEYPCSSCQFDYAITSPGMGGYNASHDPTKRSESLWSLVRTPEGLYTITNLYKGAGPILGSSGGGSPYALAYDKTSGKAYTNLTFRLIGPFIANIVDPAVPGASRTGVMFYTLQIVGYTQNVNGTPIPMTGASIPIGYSGTKKQEGDGCGGKQLDYNLITPTGDSYLGPVYLRFPDGYIEGLQPQFETCLTRCSTSFDQSCREFFIPGFQNNPALTPVQRTDGLNTVLKYCSTGNNYTNDYCYNFCSVPTNDTGLSPCAISGDPNGLYNYCRDKSYDPTNHNVNRVCGCFLTIDKYRQYEADLNKDVPAVISQGNPSFTFGNPKCFYPPCQAGVKNTPSSTVCQPSLYFTCLQNQNFTNEGSIGGSLTYLQTCVLGATGPITPIPGSGKSKGKKTAIYGGIAGGALVLIIIVIVVIVLVAKPKK